MPDLGCFGKSMANGYPLSALVGKKKYMKVLEDIFVSGTFSGDIISIAASIATIQKIKKKNIIEKLNSLGKKLKSELNCIISDQKMFDELNFDGNDWWPRLTIKSKKIKPNLFQSLLRQELISNGLLMGGSLNLCLAHCENKTFNSTLNKFKKTIYSIKGLVI